MNVTEENERDEPEFQDEPVFGIGAPVEDPLDEEKVVWSIYNEVNEKEKELTKEEKNWELRQKCLQDWFLRCSWINKVLFLNYLCHSITECHVLESILKTIDAILTKDVIESISNNLNKFDYDKIPIDDDRTLNPLQLKETMTADFLWFVNLDHIRQTQVILRLSRLGGGSLIYSVYKTIETIYKKRNASLIWSNVIAESNTNMLSQEKTGELDLQKPEKSSKNRLSKQTINNKSLDNSNSSVVNEFVQNKFHQLERLQVEWQNYKKLRGIPTEESKTRKKEETKESVDYLQILPIWLNRKIISYIDDKSLSGLKKVGKYWGKMIDESINEKSGRKAINAKINKIFEIKLGGNIRDRVENEEEFEFITELGRMELIKKKNESKKTATQWFKFYGNIFFKSFTVTILDPAEYAERCCALDKTLGMLASSTPSNIVYFYSARTGTRLNFSIFGLESTVTTLTLHEDRIHIFIGCKNGSLLCKDVKTNKSIGSFKGHTQAIISIYTTPSNLLSSSNDNTIKYFQLWSGVCLLCIDMNPNFEISSVLLRSDDKSLVVIGTQKGIVLVVDLKKKNFINNVKLHNDEITQMVHDEDFLITASANGRIRMWNMSTLQDNANILTPYYNINVKCYVTSLTFYNNQILSGCIDGTIKIISLATGNIFKTIKISSQAPILGSAIFEDKLCLKLIMWHEKGIEMRTFSLQKSSSNKKSMGKDNREGKQKAPKERNKNKISDILLPSYVGNTQTVEITPNTRDRIPLLPLKKRCCTLSDLKSRPKNTRLFKSDVFTEAFNSEALRCENEFVLKTFPRHQNFISDKK